MNKNIVLHKNTMNHNIELEEIKDLLNLIADNKVSDLWNELNIEQNSENQQKYYYVFTELEKHDILKFRKITTESELTFFNEFSLTFKGSSLQQSLNSNKIIKFLKDKVKAVGNHSLPLVLKYALDYIN